MTQAQKVKAGESGPTTIERFDNGFGSYDPRFIAATNHFSSPHNSTIPRMQTLTPRMQLKGITMLKLILLVIAALIYLAVLFGMTGDADVAKLLAGSGLAVVIALCVDQPWRAV